MLVGLLKKGRGLRQWVKAERNWNSLDLVLIGGLVGASPWWVYTRAARLTGVVGGIVGVGGGGGEWAMAGTGGAAPGALSYYSAGRRLLGSAFLGNSLAGETPSAGSAGFLVGGFGVRGNAVQEAGLGGSGPKIVGGDDGDAVRRVCVDFVWGGSFGAVFVPLAVPLSLFGADMVRKLAGRYGRWAWGLIPLIMVFNGWGTLECAIYATRRG